MSEQKKSPLHGPGSISVGAARLSARDQLKALLHLTDPSDHQLLTDAAAEIEQLREQMNRRERTEATSRTPLGNSAVAAFGGTPVGRAG